MRAIHYFSFRSPYSWIATRLLERASFSDIEMEWVPFWEPDMESERLLSARGGHFPYQPMSDAKHRYILQDVRRLSRNLGLEMRWPVDDRPHWEVAHLGYLKAKDLGGDRAYLNGVYQARWEQGRDISRPDVIAEVADAAGLDGTAIASAYLDPDIRARGVECLYRIYEDDVFGVPYFICKRDRYWGVDRLPLLVRQLGGVAHGAAMEFAGDSARNAIYEFDHAGGCG